METSVWGWVRWNWSLVQRWGILGQALVDGSGVGSFGGRDREKCGRVEGQICGFCPLATARYQRKEKVKKTSCRGGWGERGNGFTVLFIESYMGRASTQRGLKHSPTWPRHNPSLPPSLPLPSAAWVHLHIFLPPCLPSAKKWGPHAALLTKLTANFKLCDPPLRPRPPPTQATLLQVIILPICQHPKTCLRPLPIPEINKHRAP